MSKFDDINIDDFDLDADLVGEELEGTLQNLVEQDSLQWIFVGGKGGVGKTTISSCLAIQLSKHRESVLIISTDPAHNLSDAFDQKFSKDPTKVNGYQNLFAMEIDPNVESEDFLGGLGGDNGTIKNLMKDVGSSLPGIDEISSFLEIMKHVKQMKFSVVVFDTAPTGHTLRLLSFPSTLENGLGKIMGMGNIGSMLTQVSNMFGAGAGIDANGMEQKMNESKQLINNIAQQFKDPEKTTFVCVCIPEFLSVYETERLVQELTKFEIDTHNVVVNQLVLKDSSCPECETCTARMKIQKKYLNQIFDLYSLFHVVQMPLLGEEVRGPEALEKFGKNLMTPYDKVYKKDALAKDQ
ncbi:ATPase ASNA1 [Acrasis kona]|uniref:ATPase ASNA1 homolog n=1 Tax=Acrasis kona TaxID=1008807 RepID=A0AAW2YRW2_9EUKA